MRDLLEELGLPSFVKTSGSKGFHIVVPLDGEAGFDLVWRFAHGAGAVLVKRHPELLTQEFIKADRAGRILVDTGRNAPGATLRGGLRREAQTRRARLRALHLAGGRAQAVAPRTFTLRTMADRLADVGDLWRAMDGQRRSLHAAMTSLQGLLTEADWNEALAASTRRPVSRRARKS